MAALGAFAWFQSRDPQLPPSGSSTLPLPAANAELLHLDASEIVKRGAPRAIAIRFEGDVELVPHHFTQEGMDEPQPIHAWAEHLQAPVIFNAGQYDENLAHLGWLKSRGEWIVPHRHAAWQGLLLSGPRDGAAWARVADLSQAPESVVERYNHVLQSMMLFDDQGRGRVRRSNKTACRTVVAEDTQGRVLVLVTEGAVTLADLAEWLPKQDLNLVRAMNLDGGLEAQLAVRTPAFELDFHGQYGTGVTGLEGSTPRFRYPLPAVVAVRPVQRGGASMRQ